MNRLCTALVGCAVGLLALGCGDDDNSGDSDAGGDAGQNDAGDAGGYHSETYSKDENWLCRHGMTTDRCAEPPTRSELKPDNTWAAIEPAAGDQKLDCFYLYPTIDTKSPAGRAEDYGNLDDVWEVARQQVASLTTYCRVYAPLYRQMSINTYLDLARDETLETIYDDIEDAFLHYMEHYNEGRDIVFWGHSQGTHLLRRLIQRHFDGSSQSDMRDKLELAFLIGDLGDVYVPKGALVGGTFDNIPLCSSESERGCVIAFNSFPADYPPAANYGFVVGGIPEGNESACANPGALGGGKVNAAGAYFPSDPKSTYTGSLDSYKDTLSADAYFTVLRDFYTLECKRSEAGTAYLEMTPAPQAGDMRTDPIHYDSEGLAVEIVGSHLFDQNLTYEDLLQLMAGHAK